MDCVHTGPSVHAHLGLLALLAEETLHGQLVLQAHDFLVSGGARNASDPVNVVLGTALLALKEAPQIVTNVAALVVVAIGVEVERVLVLERLRRQQELPRAADLRRLIVIDVEPVLVPQVNQVVADFLSVVFVDLFALLL